jgi:hypothetical protein
MSPRQERNSSFESMTMISSQEYMLRIIAFEDLTSAQYKLDLTFQDLLTLTDGDVKLLEDSNVSDLCYMILSNLTMISRELGKPIPIKTKGGENDSNAPMKTHEDVLIVEHRIFFREEYRGSYDKKKKNITAKYDKKRQGLIRDV